MNVFEVIKKRRSVRVYKEKPISEEKLNKILEAARLAPSAHNAQDFKIVVVKDKAKKEALAKAAKNQMFIAQAPVVLAGIGLEPEVLLSSDVPSYAVDLAIAFDHITLQAVEEGLDTCWIGAFSQDEVREVLGVPSQYKVVALLPMGYAVDKPKDKMRKNIDEIVCWEQFK